MYLAVSNQEPAATGSNARVGPGVPTHSVKTIHQQCVGTPGPTRPSATKMRPTEIRIADERPNDEALAQIPQPDRAIGPARRQQPTVRAERHRPYRPAVAVEDGRPSRRV